MKVSDNKLKRCLVCAAVIVFGVTGPGNGAAFAGGSAEKITGRVYYAEPAPGGKTRGGNGTLEKPWRSLQRAVDRLKAGDTLYLTEGVYGQSAKFFSSGKPGALITVSGRGKVIFDGKGLGEYTPVFDTSGHSYLVFENFHAEDVRAAVAVNGGEHIRINNVSAQGSHFTVVLRDAAFVNIYGCEARNNRNGFRGEGTTHDITFEDVKAFDSKDIYDGYNINYLNGDGFTFENKTYNLTFKNIESSRHWDAGLDIKGSNVVIENVIAAGNKNGLKLWGNNTVIINALIHDNSSQILADGKKVDGAGINVRAGDTTVKHSTVFNNELVDVKVSRTGALRVEDSIVARKRSDGRLAGPWGEFAAASVLWHAPGKQMLGKYRPGASEVWADPAFSGEAPAELFPAQEGPAFRRGKQIFGASPVEGLTVNAGER